MSKSSTRRKAFAGSLLHGDLNAQQMLITRMGESPVTLAIGGLFAVAAAMVAADAAGDEILRWLAGGLIAAVLLRTLTAMALHSSAPASVRRRGLAYQVAALFYAAAIGALAARIIVADVAAVLQVLITCVAVGYALSVPSQTALRPVIAVMRSALAIMPLGIAALLRGERLWVLVGVFALLSILVVVAIVRQLNASLWFSIETARTSAEHAKKMHLAARTDPVTGLLNRCGLEEMLPPLVAGLPPQGQLALVRLGLDRFKQINDTLGHQAGDAVLREVGARIVAAATPSAIVARFGGDEFIVASPVAGQRAAEYLARGLLEAVSCPVPLGSAGGALGESGTTVQVGGSAGIALMPGDGCDFETIMQAADLALYNAKLNGRGQATFHEPAMTRELAVRREIEIDLRQAMLRDELSIFFQPIIDLGTGHIRSFEALVRWFHPTKGEVTPDCFIPVAEDTGAIVALGNWITAQAARIAAAWPPHVTLAVNLSPVQIRAPGAAMGILAALRKAGLPPHRLELEVTESVLLDTDAGTAAFIDELSAAGVRFALDDFGIGYSALAHLSRFRFSRIKVDRSFVSGDNANTGGEAMIRAVSEMATALDMELVAEGIETVEQAGAMMELGCRLGQGYYFSRAVPDYLAAMLLAKERETLPTLRLVS